MADPQVDPVAAPTAPQQQPQPAAPRVPRMVPLPKARSGGDDQGLPNQILAPEEPLYVDVGNSKADPAHVRRVMDAAAEAWGAPPQSWQGLEVHIGGAVPGDSEHTGRTLIRTAGGKVTGGRMDVRHQGGDVAESSIAHEVGHLILGGDYEHKDPRWRSGKFWGIAGEKMSSRLGKPQLNLRDSKVDWLGYAAGGAVKPLMPPAQSANLGSPLPDGVLADTGALPDGVVAEQGMPDGVLPDTSSVRTLVNPAGKVVGMPAEHVQAALQQGYRVPTPDETNRAARAEKYSGFGQGLTAFGEGLASTATFGVSTGLERVLGVPPEDIRGRREERPILHALGTAAGIAVPLAGEAGLLGKGIQGAAEMTAPALISRAGKAVSGAAEGVLPGVAGRLAPAVAMGGAEGALYAGQDVVEKAILGDPQLTWEKAASELGLGALFGGALGGAGKGLSELLPENLAESMADKLGETAGNRNLKAAAGPGGSKPVLRRLIRQHGEKRLTKIGQEMGELGLVSPLSSPEGTYDAAVELAQKAGGDMSKILDAADASGVGAPPIEDVIGRARHEILQPLWKNPLEQPTAQKLAGVLEGFETQYAVRPPGAWPEELVQGDFGFRELHDMRVDVSKKLFGLRGTLDPEGTEYRSALHDLRSLISDEINRGMEETGLGSDAWKAANRKYEVASVAQTLSEDGKLKHKGNNLASLTEILAALTGAATHGIPGGAIAGLGMHFAREHASGIIGWAATGAQRRLLQLSRRSDRALSAAVSDIFEHAAPAAGGRAATGTEGFAHGGLVTPENFADVSSHLRDYGSSLDRLASVVSEQTGGLQDHAPQVAQAAHSFAARVIAQLLPQLPDGGQRQLLDPPFRPSHSELEGFHHSLDVANRGPVAVLQHVRNSTLRPEHLAASMALYPSLHAAAVQAVHEKLAEHLSKGKRVPMALRHDLSLFLGSPLEHAQTPQAILAAQMAFAGAPADPMRNPQAAQPAQRQSGRSRNVETRAEQRAATGSQGNELRMAKV